MMSSSPKTHTALYLRRNRLAVVAVLVALLLSLAMGAPVASALKAAPGWAVTTRSYPTNLPPGGHGQIEIDLFNVGAADSEGKVTVTDTLPAGVTATEAGGLENAGGENIAEDEVYIEEAEHEGELSKQAATGSLLGGEPRAWSCSGTTVVTCTTRPGFGGVLRPIPSGGIERIGIDVSVAANAAGAGTNQVSVSGGGALSSASVSKPVTISSAEPPFGLAGLDGWYSNADGTPDTQAGSHPYAAYFTFDLNQAHGRTTGGALRDIKFELPPGLVGNPAAVPQCPRQEFEENIEGYGCPPSTQVGVERPGLPFQGDFATFMPTIPIYNLVPPPGVAAQFGFFAVGSVFLLDSGVRSGGDYGITVDSDNLQLKPSYDTTVIWGVPGEASHDAQRCGQVNGADTCGFSSSGTSSSGATTAKAFLTLPTSCGDPAVTRGRITTWETANTAEASYVSHDQNHAPLVYKGCEHLAFEASISASPDTSFADTPAGLTVDVKVPQEGLLAADGLATANIRNTTVTLPEGVSVNPGQAAGLQACGAAEDGLTTEAEKAKGEEDAGPPSCVNASKVGTDEIVTPLLAKPLQGNVYLLQSNPPELKLLVAASGQGVNLKLVGDVHLDPMTGRLTTTFNETPELPFTDFKLAFSGGAQAALVTPLRCGSYATSSVFAAWASPFVEDVFPPSDFSIDRGPGGSACSSSLPFAPNMIAGATTDQAGGYTGFSMLLSRGDGQQRISALQFKTPEGLLGMISNVPLCGEPQASQGTCSAASQIGHTVVQAGPGPYPLLIPEAGRPAAPIYLTGGYKGAPYGLSIVVPLQVGPFDLGTIVVRAKIEVDPHTTQLTVTTDPLPTIVAGVPADMRTIDAVIDRPQFMFNPTNCEPQAFTGTATSTEGAEAPLSSHFQMGSCRALLFKPDFKVSTQAKTSRADGASLTAKIVYPTGNLGANQASSQSNIREVKVELPKKLPSRLTTLQKACLAQVFEANPANCPAASMVGHATAITPVLPVPLTGPAYFVSHGNEAFPSLEVVLQGYGVTVDLVGATFISKRGITSSTFKQVPDVPIASFELVLPEGPYSALAALGNLCRGALKMPTEFTAQDGAVLHQSTPITPTGCPKAKRAVHRRKAKHKRRAPGRGRRTGGPRHG